MTTINIRVDEKVKNEATALFESLGLDMTTALNIFLRQSITYGGIPFEIRKPNPCAVSSQAEIYAKLKEAEDEIKSGAPSMEHEEVWAKLRAKYESKL